MSSNPSLGFSSRRRACPAPTVKGSIGDRRRPTHPAARRRAATSGEKTLAQSRVELDPVTVLVLLTRWRLHPGRCGGAGSFVPSGFVVPLAFATEQFRLEPLGPQHNDSDY